MADHQDTTTALDTQSPPKRQRVAAPQEDEDDKAIEAAANMTCSICRGLLHTPATLSPCMHTYCGGCISTWIQTHSDCPQCRQKATHVSKNHQLDAIVSLFAAAHPALKRSVTEIADLDARNKVGGAGLVVVKPVAGNVFGSDVDEDEDGSGSSEEEEEEVLLTTCPHCPPNSSAVDAFSCDATTPLHVRCFQCASLMPDRHLDTQQCKYCCRSFCNLYFASSGGCSADPNSFMKLEDFKFSFIPYDTFSGNTFERSLLLQICESNDITFDTLFSYGLQLGNLVTGPNLMPHTAAAGIQVSSDHFACRDCAGAIFNESCFVYRRDMEADLIPDAVKNREKCWYGRDCRTQRHNAAHASRLDHVCENIRK
ncbi:hypothetical protein HDU98_005101 [Podochytrium sp. JEL0797]|nr:hypothetical protein HDU98_005101 [Podochytrium sp. JEL0797]